MYKTGVPDEVLEKLPDPTGYRLLVAMAKVSDKSSGGVWLPDERKEREGLASIIGLVLKAGPEAYEDKSKFPSGAWCKAGDWVILKSYSGIRFNVTGSDQMFSIVEDDSIAAVVANPTELIRA
jgi:co-chaperonin GroES (HSP10)